MSSSPPARHSIDTTRHHERTTICWKDGHAKWKDASISDEHVVTRAGNRVAFVRGLATGADDEAAGLLSLPSVPLANTPPFSNVKDVKAPGEVVVEDRTQKAWVIGIEEPEEGQLGPARLAIGSGYERIVRGPKGAGHRVIVIPVCNGPGALVIALSWEHESGRRRVFAWTDNVRRVHEGVSPPVCKAK